MLHGGKNKGVIAGATTATISVTDPDLDEPVKEDGDGGALE